MIGETSADGLFTMTEVECLGACTNAPMLQINNHEFYENLDEQSTIQLLSDLKSGKPVKVGPQNGQISCEGPGMLIYCINYHRAPCQTLTQYICTSTI